MKRKGRVSGIIRVIVLIIIAVLLIGGVVCWSFLSKEHREAQNLPLDGVDFGNLKDGTYIGVHEGGMYKWRANKVQVAVSAGKVSGIELLEQKENQKPEFTHKLYDRVIKAQSLQIEAISGATLTSKAYLKGVENALKQAQE